MSNILNRVQKWYMSQCNGVWEHAHGIKIDTLDNPGWKITIDLKSTPWENALWEELKYDRTDSDWLRCSKTADIFVGYGDPTKLEEILDYFVRHVE